MANNKYISLNISDGGGGGGSYTLPIASANVLGGVKIGSGVTIASDGKISVDAPDMSNYTPTSGFSTVNGSAITVGGNVVIDTSNVIELTKAQYEALVDKDPDALYVITDADVIDLNDYALASALTAVETATTANTAAIANKADKTNVTARTSGYYFPKWTSQGVISGDTQVYQRSLSINGTAKNMIQGTNSDFTGIYAPTSAGTAGQPLLSNGSGAPVWGGYKFAFITQTAYDALTTPDATTIYFIIGD